MKKTTICILMCVIAACVFAADSQKEAKTRAAQKPSIRNKSQSQAETARPAPTQRGGAADPQQRRQGYQQMLARRAEVQAAAIAELVAIKKIAQEENAERTVEAIQALIDKKNTEYQERVKKQEAQRRERAEQMQQRTQQGRTASKEPTKTAEAKPAKKESVKPENDKEK